MRILYAGLSAVSVIARQEPSIFWFVGVKGDYRRVFWRYALARLRRGEIEFLISVTLLAHHLILFAREASAGRRNASNYSAKSIEEVLVAAE